MASSKSSIHPAYCRPPPLKTPDDKLVLFITPHAIRQCMARARAPVNEAVLLLHEIVREGEAWDTPRGPAIRLGLYAVGYTAHRDHPDGAVITTFYYLDNPMSVRKYQREVIGPDQRKPGRSKAWSRLKHQGKHCRQRPTLPEGDPDPTDPR